MKKDAQQLAQSFFLKSDMTREQISKAVGVTPKTLKSWIDNGKWEEMKALQSVTRPQLLQDAYAQLAAVNKAIAENGNLPTKEHYDAKSILRKEIDSLSNTPVALMTSVMHEFLIWMMKYEPKEFEKYSTLSTNFLNYQRNANS